MYFDNQQHSNGFLKTQQFGHFFYDCETLIISVCESLLEIYRDFFKKSTSHKKRDACSLIFLGHKCMVC